MSHEQQHAVAMSEHNEVSTSRVREFTPPVDIIEDSEAIVLRGDMPGVSVESLDVRVDKGNLIVRGTVKHPAVPEEAVYSEYRDGNYSRSFALGEDLDVGGITAEIADGVVQIRIPKAEKARPRRIDVKKV